MKRFTILFLLLSGMFAVLSGQGAGVAEVVAPAPFNLLEPADGSHILFTSPTEMVTLRWEDVLELGEGSEDPERYYILRPALDPALTLEFEDDILWESQLIVPASDIGFVFRFMELLSGSKVDTVTIYWTVAAVDEDGTTWASDTFHVNFSIDNEPPLADFSLIGPEDASTVGVLLGEDTPLEGSIPFTWNPTTDPDVDTVYYFWVMSNVYPLPDILTFFEGDGENGDNESVGILNQGRWSIGGNPGKRAASEEDPILLILPSGEFDSGSEWEFGGIESYLNLPYEIAYYWILGGMPGERLMYWTVIATDGFGIIHWVSAGDTLSVTLKTLATSVDGTTPGIPSEYALAQNYPNPFNPTTQIQFALPERTHTKLSVYTLLGQEVMRLIDGEIEAGTHETVLDATSLPSGVYIYRIQAGNFTESKRLVLMR